MAWHEKDWYAALGDLLIWLTPHIPLLIAGLGAVALGLLLWLWAVARRAGAEARQLEAELDRLAQDEVAVAGRLDASTIAFDADRLPALPLTKGFRKALRLLKAHVAGPEWRYAIPWYLLIGPQACGKSTLAANTDLNLPIGPPVDEWEEESPACSWWFFDHGVLLDIAGRFVRAGPDGETDAQGWSTLLRMLREKRAQRPIDGLVLVLPIDDLLDEQGAPRPAEDVAHRMAPLHRCLQQAQTRLQLALPIYLVLSKADRLTGFKTLVGELPIERHGEMMGWSNPFAPDVPFLQEWASEALDQITADLRAAQLAVLAERGALNDTEALFQLPAAMMRLRAPLAAALHTLFRPEAQPVGAGLRGIYLSGDGGRPPPPGMRPMPVLPGVYSGPKHVPRPVFLQHLFADKIFAEATLAQPMRAAVTRRTRIKWALQAACLVVLMGGGVGLAWDYANVRAGVASLTPFVRDARDVMAQEGMQERTQEGLGDAMPALLAAMRDVELSGLRPTFMPTAWVGDVEARVLRLADQAFHHVVVRALPATLERKGRAVIAGQVPSLGSPGDGDPTSSPTRSAASDLGPEHRQMVRLVAALQDFEQALGHYEALRETANPKDLAALLRYLHGVGLPDGVWQRRGFFAAALRDADLPALPMDEFRRAVAARYRALE
jgi:type VI secretion system protein ImpL